MKEKVVAALQAAGEKGASLKELEAKLKLKSGTLGPWFASTGKKVKQIKNVGRGQYVWKEKAMNDPKAIKPAKANNSTKVEELVGADKQKK